MKKKLIAKNKIHSFVILFDFITHTLGCVIKAMKKVDMTQEQLVLMRTGELEKDTASRILIVYTEIKRNGRK